MSGQDGATVRVEVDYESEVGINDAIDIDVPNANWCIDPSSNFLGDDDPNSGTRYNYICIDYDDLDDATIVVTVTEITGPACIATTNTIFRPD
jgi:hypothetical protein